MPVEASKVTDKGKDYILIKSEMRYYDLLRTIPGAYWKANLNAWRMPLSWASCVQIKNSFGAELAPDDELTAWLQKEYTERVVPSTVLRDATELPEGEGDPDLFPHQRAGVKFLAQSRRALLADEPGLGKTAQAIRGLTELTRQGVTSFPAMVVCPNTLKQNWKREFEKWWPGIRVLVIDGTPAVRRKQFEAYFHPKEGELRPHVIVINWEALKLHSRLAPYGSVALKKCEEHGGADPKVTAAKCEVHDKELNQIEFAAVIADEIHRAKNPKSAQTRALWSATGDAAIRFALTGTPQSGNVTDLWSIMHWLSPEEWPSKSKWIDRTVVTQDNAFGGTMILGLKPTQQQEFFDILNPRMRRMLKKVVLPFLPPILNQVRTVEMSAKQKKAYTDMEKSMIAEVEGGHLLVKTPLTRAKRLQQFATAYAEMIEDGTDAHGNPKYRVKLSEPSSTAEAIATDIIEGDFGPQSIAVMAVSSQLLELISARLTKANIPHGMITGDYSLDIRQNAIDAFQAGHTKVILYTAQAGGVGVTLTKASVLLRAEIPYSLIDYLQANDRVHRIGSEQHESILIVDYFAKDTVQYKTFEAIERKGLNFEEVVRDQDQLAKLLAEEQIVPWQQ
ncbi:DNA helicase [Microbacterium phage Cece]|nr:DNA helicase [Microbacterium phage Cece]